MLDLGDAHKAVAVASILNDSWDKGMASGSKRVSTMAAVVKY